MWAFGRDVGYGYGWRMMAGSITPVYRNWGDLSHYLYTDSTGAEYRLTQNTGGVWTGGEGVMIAFDSNIGLLRFPDGSWWAMWAESAPGEDDAGTFYTSRLVKEIVRDHRWSKKYLDGLGRTVKEETGYGGVFRPVGSPLPEVTETVVDTQYVPCACSPLPLVSRQRPGKPIPRAHRSVMTHDLGTGNGDVGPGGRNPSPTATRPSGLT